MFLAPTMFKWVQTGTQMKDFHPDLSGDDESTEFCMLLNDIYEVRSKATKANADCLTVDSTCRITDGLLHAVEWHV
jgi:hypothetical protein